MLYIRTDMNDIIATGHVMRCLAIADAASNCGEKVTFLLADEQAVELVAQRGYRAIVLHTYWNDMDGELSELIRVVEKEKIEKLFIDSYQVTERYLRILTSHVKTVYIDDRNTFVYPVNGIICYANYWTKFDYHSRYKETKLFMGPKYVPLRHVFCHCGEKRIRNRVEELLLLSGGTDPCGVLKRALEKIDKSKYKTINVICGKYYAGYETLQKEYRLLDNVHIYRALSNIEEYMKTADIAVSAGGTTLYELCACGTPTISYAFADNQLDNVRQFQEDGMIDYAGDVRYDRAVENMIHYLDIYQEDMPLRLRRSKKMQELVDGNGALRIVEALKDI